MERERKLRLAEEQKQASKQKTAATSPLSAEETNILSNYQQARQAARHARMKAQEEAAAAAPQSALTISEEEVNNILKCYQTARQAARQVLTAQEAEKIQTVTLNNIPSPSEQPSINDKARKISEKPARNVPVAPRFSNQHGFFAQKPEPRFDFSALVYSIALAPSFLIQAIHSLVNSFAELYAPAEPKQSIHKRH